MSSTMQLKEELWMCRTDISGDFSDSILHQIEHLLQRSVLKLKVRKKLFIIAVEVLQNIITHACQRHKNAVIPSSVLLIGCERQCCMIRSGNTIENKEIPALQDALENITRTDPAARQELYLNTLANKVISNSGGAGLGLMTMARKSTEKIEWSFVEMNQALSYFWLTVRIDCTKKSRPERRLSRMNKFNKKNSQASVSF